MLSFNTEVEELNIATRADTMMTALSPQSSYSITNGRVWCQRLFPQHYTLPTLTAFIAESCSSFKDMLKAPRRRRQLLKKRKNNLPFPRKWRLTLSQYTKIYQRILFYQDSNKIIRMRERLVPGPYLSLSAHRARIRAWVRGYSVARSNSIESGSVEFCK